MRKIRVWAFTALLAALPLLAVSCTPAAQTAETAEAQTPVTLTALQFELDNQAIDFGNQWFFQELEKKTGVHVDFEEVKEVDWDGKLNLMFASGSLTDMIIRGEVDVEEYGVSQHLLLPLEDLIPQYMPNYSALLAIDDAGASIPSSDGHSYYVGFLISQEVNADGHFFINREWLNKLGLQVPTTVEELTDTLRAFRDGDPNGNGLADEIPYEATFDDNNFGLYNAFAFWGVPMNEHFVCIGEDGKVYCPALLEGFRECAAWLHTLYEEKLLDIECLTQSSNLWGAKINQGISGFFTYWRLTNTVLKPEVADQFTCILPVSAGGYQAKMSRIMDTVEFGAGLTTANQHVEESLRWLDAQFDTETMMVSQNGPMGEMLTLDEDGRYRVEYIPEDNELYSIVPVICGQFFAPPSFYNRIYTPAAHRLEKKAYSEYYEENGVMEPYSFQILTVSAPKTVEESKRIQELRTELKNEINNSLVGFITQGVTDESWNDYLLSLADTGVAEYVALYQTVYDRYAEAGHE